MANLAPYILLPLIQIRDCLKVISSHMIGKSQYQVINMVREPGARMVSVFYFFRKKSLWTDRKSPPAEWFEKDFNRCVLEEDSECQVLMFFFFS